MNNFELDITIDTLLSNDLLTIKGNKKQISVIDPFEFTKNIKQLALLIKSLKSEKKREINVNLLVSSKFIKTNIQQFLIKSNINKFIKISNNVNEIKSEDIVIICGDFNIKELNYFLDRLFRQNKYIFNIISNDENIYSKKDGSYILYNENNQLKKIFYFVTLINKLILN